MESTMKRFLMSLALTLATVVPACAQSLLVCTFEKNATVKRESSGKFSVEGGTDEAIVLEPGGLGSETIVLAGLDSGSPVLRGNLGESKLEVLRRVKHTQFGEVIWLAEAPPLGGVNVYTVFLKSKTVIESKQLYLYRSGPYGTVAIGKCE